MLSCKLDLLDFVNHLYSKVNTLERKKSKLCRQSRLFFHSCRKKKGFCQAFHRGYSLYKIIDGFENLLTPPYQHALRRG